jgi:hypothetical protein
MMKRRMMLYSKYFIPYNIKQDPFFLNDGMGSKRIGFFPIMLQKEELLRKLAKNRLGVRVQLLIVFLICLSFRFSLQFLYRERHEKFIWD